MQRYHEGSPIGPRSDYETLHDASYDVFVTSRRHGKDIWHLHYQADVKLVDTMSEMTRAQKIVLSRADAYWSEKAREQGRSNVPSSVKRRTP